MVSMSHTLTKMLVFSIVVQAILIFIHVGVSPTCFHICQNTQGCKNHKSSKKLYFALLTSQHCSPYGHRGWSHLLVFITFSFVAMSLLLACS